MSDRHVVLVGMMGAGKTTTGRALATALDRRFVDSDLEIEERTGATGAALATTETVAALHDLEAAVLTEALSSPEPTVIGAAASVVESEACRAALASGPLVVWLEAPVDELTVRMAAGDHRRPLSPAETEELLERRERWFAELADLRIDARRPTDELVAEVHAALTAVS